MDLWYTRVESPSSEFRFKVRRPLYSTEDEKRRIDILETEDLGLVLLINGRLAMAEIDSVSYREFMAHTPLNGRPGIKRVLITGGGDGNILSELCRYAELETITVAEPDEGLMRASRQFFPALAAGFEDPRVRLAVEDSASFIRDTKERYDLILVDNLDKSRGAELGQAFYCDAFRVLSGDGVLVHSAGSAFFPHKKREFLASIGKVKRLFPLYRIFRTDLPSTECGPLLLGYASKRYDPLEYFDASAWEEKRLDTRHYGAEQHKAAFVLPKELANLMAGA